jgi:light-regulated signal transduction histidine kinase (bacteriophytochrome)
MYNTNLNKVLKFIVENIFLRVSQISDMISFNFDLDINLPEVHVNEFVIWELFEPLIQNAIEHGGSSNLTIDIKTFYDKENNTSAVYIIDNGKGIDKRLLLKNADGVENIFLENMSTKSNSVKEGGYGCYIAYLIARRCGWNLSVTNNIKSGATFTVSIKNY